jgi:anti-sigma factor RsiW
MNRHPHVFHLLSDYIDGCLSSTAASRVEAHLGDCPTCARELEQWRAVLRLVSRHASVYCPIDCAEAVVQRLQEGERNDAEWGVQRASSPPAPHPLVRLWLSAVAVIMLLVGGWACLQSLQTHPAPSPIVRAGNAPAALPATSAVHVDAPERLEGAFGRSDSLILASDFADDDR